MLELLKAEREANLLRLRILDECSLPKKELRFSIGVRINAVEAMACRIEAMRNKALTPMPQVPQTA
jgi:hypothetical protein